MLTVSLLTLLEGEQEFPCSYALPIPLLAATSPSLLFYSCPSLPLTTNHTSSCLPPSFPSHCATVAVSLPSPSWSSLTGA